MTLDTLTSLDISVQAMIDLLASSFPNQKRIEGQVPAATQLTKIADGSVAPYIVYNFGDPVKTGDAGFAGPRGDSFSQAFNLVAIAPDAVTARKLRSQIFNAVLGFIPPYSGPVDKRPGGGTFVIASDNGAVQAFAAPSSYFWQTSLVDLS